MNMKTMNRKSLLIAGLCALTVSFGTAVHAQYKPVGDDGIAASPKVRQMLNERKASTAPAATAVRSMACPKCADIRTTEVNRQAKGAEILAGAATKTGTKHTCTDCSTKIVTAGTGKAKHSVALHTCGTDVKAVCCASN
jgi:hypothetical protein